MGDLQGCFMEDPRSTFANGVYPVPVPRFSHSATVVGKRIYIFGGDQGGILTNDVQILDTLTGKWITPMVLGTKPSPRQGHSAVSLDNDRILILGGTSEPKDNIWFLEVDTPFIRRQKEVQGKEVVAWSKGAIGDSPQPVVISGPSGVGKGTLISKLMEEFPSTFGFSVSHTTRLPREKEMAGVHYHFTQRGVMEMEDREGKFLETANVHGNMYGTSIAAVEAVADAGKRCILDIDVQGAKSVRGSTLDALFIFICPPSFEDLEKRLRGRGTEKEDQIQKRLRNAKEELKLGTTPSLFDYILVNDNLEICYQSLKDVLGLNEGFLPLAAANGLSKSRLEDVELLPGHSASLTDQTVTVYGGMTPDGRASNNIHVLDVSSLEGGAPGRTRGLRLSSLDQLSDPCRCAKQGAQSADQNKIHPEVLVAEDMEVGHI